MVSRLRMASTRTSCMKTYCSYRPGAETQSALRHSHQGVWLSRWTYFRLDQKVPLSSDVFQKPQNVHGPLVLDLLQHAVDDHVGSCSSYTGTSTRRTKSSMTTVQYQRYQR